MISVSERNLAIIDDIDSAKIQSWRENPQEAVESLEKKMALSKKTVFKTMCIHELANYKFKPREPILSPWLNSQDL